MKKNKTIAYMMAATLLVGGTFMGTKAWFSDSATSDNGIQITMGTLDLKVEDTTFTDESGTDVSGWKLVRDITDQGFGSREESKADKTVTIKNEELHAAKNNDISNVHNNLRPKDQFERTIKVTNDGTLDQIVTVENLFENGNIKNELFDVKISSDNQNNELKNGTFRLNVGESKDIKLVMTIKESMGNDHQGETISFSENDGLGTVTISSEQVNRVAKSSEIKPN